MSRKFFIVLFSFKFEKLKIDIWFTFHIFSLKLKFIQWIYSIKFLYVILTMTLQFCLLCESLKRTTIAFEIRIVFDQRGNPLKQVFILNLNHLSDAPINSFNSYVLKNREYWDFSLLNRIMIKFILSFSLIKQIFFNLFEKRIFFSILKKWHFKL